MATYVKTGLVSFSALAIAVTMAGFTGAAYAQSDEEYIGAAHHSLISGGNPGYSNPGPSNGPHAGYSEPSPMGAPGAHAQNQPAPSAAPEARATGSILDSQPCYVDIPAYDKNGKFLGRGMINTCY
jgi:hypothetical protein